MRVKFYRDSWKRIGGGLLCAALLMLGSTGQALELQGKIWSAPEQQSVTVYQEPRLDAGVSGTLADGTLVDILSQEDGWYKISWVDDISTLFGFVRQEDMLPMPGEMAETSDGLIAPADGKPLPLYQLPDTGSRVLGSYYPGNGVLATELGDGWACVMLYGGSRLGEGISGYMQTGGLRLHTGGEGVALPFGELTGEVLVPILRKPDPDAQVLGPVAPGAQVRIMGESGEYLHIAAGSFTGYVRREQVETLSTTYSNVIPPLSEGRAFAVVRGDAGSTLQAYPYCEEKESGDEIVLPAGSGLWVIRELGEWGQVDWDFYPDRFVRSEWLDIYPAPSVFSEEVADISLGAGLYVVGDDLPADAYCFRVPADGQGTLEVRWPEGVIRQHTPVPGTLYNIYLPRGVSVTLSGDGVLEPVDKTFLRSNITGEYPPDTTGRYICGLNLEPGPAFIKLLEGETEGYYRVHRISQEAGDGAPGEELPLVPGVERRIIVEYGDILEIVNGYMWTNG